ncbi:MAG: hypothetical protein AABY16_02995 [Nanoarchaeota archaeon]
MKKLILFFALIIANLIFVFAQPTLETPQVTTITTVDTSLIESVNFFNDGSEAVFTASLGEPSSVISLDSSSVFVEENSYGTFSLHINTENTLPSIYFNSLKIYRNGAILFDEILIIAVTEDKAFNVNHDVIIDLQPHDIDYISGELVLSPSLNVYRLNYDSPLTGVALRLSVYTIDGELLDFSEENLAVSGTASFERFINLGNNPPEEVIIVAATESAGRTGFDIAHFNTVTGVISFSPPLEKKDYSTWIYFGVFILLIGFVLIMSYFWSRRTMKQAKEWRSQVNYIKKTQFTDSARALRKLQLQRDVILRAYNNHYISRDSYQKGIFEIDKLMTSIKKRL